MYHYPQTHFAEAEDADSPGRGSHESDTDPFESLTIRAEESPEEQPDEYESSDESSTFSENEEDDPELMTTAAAERARTHPRKGRDSNCITKHERPPK